MFDYMLSHPTFDPQLSSAGWIQILPDNTSVCKTSEDVQANQWFAIQSLFQLTPHSQHHSALHRGHCMCMQPPAGGDNTLRTNLHLSDCL